MSWDGFGHQLEAKLSCIAVAAALKMEYVHVPFRSHVHGQNSEALEDNLALSRMFRKFDAVNMQVLASITQLVVISNLACVLILIRPQQALDERYLAGRLVPRGGAPLSEICE